MRPELWMDSENGGLDPQVHSPLEFAFLAVKDDKIVDRCAITLRIEPLVVTQEALKINKVDLCKSGWTTKEQAILDYKRFMTKNFGRPTKETMPFFCGHNTFYDRPFLQKIVGDFDFAYYHRIDTMVFANVLRAEGMLPGIENLKLETISTFLRLAPPERFHDALCDVEQTYKVYRMLRRLMKGEALESIRAEGAPQAELFL
jgi:DNA polymerase III alpha subunit (gram-positive type)